MFLDPESVVATELRRSVKAAQAYALLPTNGRSDKRWRWRRLAWFTHGRPMHS